MRTLILWSCLLVAGFNTGSVRADWLPAANDKLQQRAHATEQRFRSWQNGRLQPYFDEAWAWAIYPSVTRGGFMLGGGYGKGVVVEAGSFAGYTSQWRFSVGFQLGVQNQAQIIFFRDARTLEAFQHSKLEFNGQASVSVAMLGAAFDPGFNPRVAVFSLTRAGLMVELSAAAAKFRYATVPIPQSRPARQSVYDD